MMKRVLTENQRWLLRTMGGWQIIDALIGPGGVNHLMTSRWGGSRGEAIPGAPAWMHSFETTASKVHSPCSSNPKTTISAPQLNRFAKSLPATLRQELEQCALERTQNTWKAHDWCHCGQEQDCHRAHAGDPLYGGRHHPTDAEEQAHRDEFWRIHNWEDDLLDRALGFVTIDEPVGQLELFEVA